MSMIRSENEPDDRFRHLFQPSQFSHNLSHQVVDKVGRHKSSFFQSCPVSDPLPHLGKPTNNQVAGNTWLLLISAVAESSTLPSTTTTPLPFSQLAMKSTPT